MSFTDNFVGKLCILELSVKRKFVFWFTIWNLVNSEKKSIKIAPSQGINCGYLNHSLVVSKKPGITCSTSSRLLSSAARGSLTSMTIIFQSASPSSIMARVPKHFTANTSPLFATLNSFVFY